MYLYGMKRETRKKFKTLFHVEQKTENKMSAYTNMDFCIGEYNNNEMFWTCEQSGTVRYMTTALCILGEFIKSLKQ